MSVDAVRGAEVRTKRTLIAAIVGIDGCGKSSTFAAATHTLAESIPVVGVGDQVLSGGPGEPVRERTGIPLSRSARTVGRVAKGLRWPGLYKDLKFLEFIERTRIRDHVIAQDSPAALLTDGDPLVNIAAWAAARFYRDDLATTDAHFVEVLHYLAGERRIPAGELSYYLRRAWQLVVLNRLHLARFGFPDLVFLLQIDPAVAMNRIRARGRPLQVHENEAFLSELASAYERVCGILEKRCDVSVVRIPVDSVSHEDAVREVVGAVLGRHARRTDSEAVEECAPDSIEIIATTMSGSIKDQRKVGLIGPEFRARTSRRSRVHLARSHAEARMLAHEIVDGGGRTLVSAGGAGTFNAVLEGSHLGGGVPPDVRLAFLRKGSADLIGKTLRIPDDLSSAVDAIVDGFSANRCVAADILAVEATEPDGSIRQRHMVGFGGLGVFGEVPRFTETRLAKLYKGVLGSLLGDLGPFYVGLFLAVVWWWIRHSFGRVPPLSLTLDGADLPPDVWSTVIVLNGDLGKDLPLGRNLSLSSGTFRVVALRYRGMRAALRQISACRTATVLDDPGDYAAVVMDVGSLVARPTQPCPPYMVNVDGLRMMTRGAVRVSVSGRVQLVAGPPESRPSGDSTGPNEQPSG